MFQEALQIEFGETEPEVRIHFAGFLEVVSVQVEDGGAAARFENSPRFGDGALGVRRVVQRLAEEGHIDRAGAYGHVFQVAQAVFQVGDAVLARQASAEFDHFRRVVDGDDAPGALCHELRDGAFARSQVGDDQRRHQAEQRFGDPLPGAARHVLAAKLARQLIEVTAHLILPFAEREAQGGAVLGSFGNLGRGLAQDGHQSGGSVQLVERVLAGASVGQQAGLFQLRQMRRNLTLRLAHDCLQLGHGKFFLLEQQEQAQPARIGGQAQRFQD